MRNLFEIFKVNNQDASYIQSQINKPHIHLYEELIIGVQGRIEHFIDFKSTTYDAPFTCFITKGKTHKIVPESKDGICELWVLRFKSEFIAETAFNLYSIFHNSANLVFKPGREFNRLVLICEMIDEEMLQIKPELIIVRKLVSTLLTMIELEQKAQQPEFPQQRGNQDTTFINFLNILEDNFRRTQGVNFYAEKLFMSAKNLNRITHRIWQQSVSEIIETRKLLEAKNLLLTSDKSISEIGFEIGYSDKAYFTSVFKKKSGLTPTAFREEMRALTS